MLASLSCWYWSTNLSSASRNHPASSTDQLAGDGSEVTALVSSLEQCFAKGQVALDRAVYAVGSGVAGAEHRRTRAYAALRITAHQCVVKRGNLMQGLIAQRDPRFFG